MRTRYIAQPDAAAMNRPSPTPRQLKVLRIPSAVANRERRNHERRTEAEPPDDLVSLSSHELRNAVSSIVGCAELIDSGDLADDALHLYTGILLREGRRLSAFVNSAVTLQRLEHGHRELALAPVDVRSLILRAVLAAGEDDLRPIEVDVPDALPLVAAEAEAILDVLANFISNARVLPRRWLDRDRGPPARRHGRGRDPRPRRRHRSRRAAQAVP